MNFPSVDRLGAYDRVHMALEVLAAHPSTAKFISRKLAEHYVGLPAPNELVDDLAIVFMETNGDMRQMLLTIARHDVFWQPDLPKRLAQPLDFAMRLCRTTDRVHPWSASQFLQRSGTGLFDRPTPDGYPEEDESYADSNALLQRWKLAQESQWALAGLVPGQWRYTQNHQTDDWAQNIVDVLAVRLTGWVLGPDSNEAAISLLKECKGDSNRRVVQIAPFIAQLPEANLR